MKRRFVGVGSIEDLESKLKKIELAKENDRLLDLDMKEFPEWTTYLTVIEGAVEPGKELDIQEFYSRLYEAWGRMIAVNVLQADLEYETKPWLIDTTELLLDDIARICSGFGLTVNGEVDNG